MQASAQRAVDVLLEKYSESHQHPVNELVHCICVPAIVFSVLGLLWAAHPWAACIVVGVAMLYYLSLSLPLALGMAVMSGAFLALLNAMPASAILPVSGAVFVLAWIGQFIGHKIEGKKPSFFEDLRFLAIGPLFVLGVLYRRLGLAY